MKSDGYSTFNQAHRTTAERSAELRPNVVCKDETLSFTSVCTERPENGVRRIYLSKQKTVSAPFY